MSRGSFNELVGSLRETLAGLPDRRTGQNLSYAMEDFGLSAFAVFYRWVNLLQGPELGTLKIRVKSGSQWHTYAYRWKIENESNNTLKTKGYHLEHNFGHGKEHLSSLLAAMNILAFLYHAFLSFTDQNYRLIRAQLPTRQTFFDDLRALTRYILFPNWDAVLDFMMRGLEIGPYAKPT